MELAMVGDDLLRLEQLDSVYLDRGTFFGDGVYEVIRSYNGKLFAFDEHIRRFENGLKAIGIKNIDVGKIREKVVTAFETARIPDAKIYFHLTRGSGPRRHDYTEALEPNFLLTITELEDTDKYKKGVSVITHPDWRWKRCDIKSLNLLPNVLAKQAAADKGTFEAILVNENGYITEGASSAFFAVFDKKIHTTPLKENILPSISRKFVIKAGKNLGLDIIEQHLTPEDAKKADELFLAVTTKDIVPVIEFDSVKISDNQPGETTLKIAEEFKKFTV